MTSGGQCVMIAGTVMMPLWSANNWDMHILEVSTHPMQDVYWKFVMLLYVRHRWSCI